MDVPRYRRFGRTRLNDSLGCRRILPFAKARVQQGGRIVDKCLRMTICIAVVILAVGCTLNKDKKRAYNRVAFVCGPASTASPDIANEILRAAEATMRKELPYLARADILYDAEFDTTGTVSMPIVPDAARNYDGVFSLLYENSDAQSSLEIILIDTRGGDVVWRYLLSKTPNRSLMRIFDSAGGNTHIRLIKFGTITPKVINKDFYRQ